MIVDRVIRGLRMNMIKGLYNKYRGKVGIDGVIIVLVILGIIVGAIMVCNGGTGV